MINKLTQNGFEVANNGLVRKYSNTHKKSKVYGQINKGGVYFFAQNVSPYHTGQNTFKEVLGNNEPYFYEPITAPPTTKREFTFEEYLSTTQKKSQFEIYLKKFSKEELGIKLNSNLYNIRGVKNGYLEDAVLYPYINFNNTFLSAKISKYNSITGKRTGQNNWFHAYKPIKKELGIKSKIEKNGSCFYGEHLIAHNNKPVVIVEAEKTATILSLVFKNIIFIAPGNLTSFKNLDWSFLVDRQVFVFPDKGAEQWFDIAEDRNWWISGVVEEYGLKGDDILDCYGRKFESESTQTAWLELQNQLLGIEQGNITATDLDGYSLSFEHKKNPSLSYCLPISLDMGLIYYQDNAKGRSFKSKHFLIFENKFQVLNANKDFNRPKRNNGKLGAIDEQEFLNRLEESFKIIKHLNPDQDCKPIFSKILTNILINSNYTFNRNYIERVLIPVWDNDKLNISEYLKNRNWRYYSKESLDKKEFEKELNESKKLFTVNQHLKKLQPLLENKEFILPEHIGLHYKKGNEYVWELIQKYNTEVLGCKTIKSYKGKMDISKFINSCFTAQNIKCTQKVDSPYYTTNIGCQENERTKHFPSIRDIISNVGVGARIVKEFFNFKPALNVLDDIQKEIKYFLAYAQEFKFEREKGRLSAIPDKQPEIKEILLNPSTAFDYEPDLNSSILNCDEGVAILQGGKFYLSWLEFYRNKQKISA